MFMKIMKASTKTMQVICVTAAAALLAIGGALICVEQSWADTTIDSVSSTANVEVSYQQTGWTVTVPSGVQLQYKNGQFVDNYAVGIKFKGYLDEQLTLSLSWLDSSNNVITYSGDQTPQGLTLSNEDSNDTITVYKGAEMVTSLSNGYQDAVDSGDISEGGFWSWDQEDIDSAKVSFVSKADVKKPSGFGSWTGTVTMKMTQETN